MWFPSSRNLWPGTHHEEWWGNQFHHTMGRTDKVFYTDGHGNTEKENPSRMGVREGFSGSGFSDLSIHVSICQSSHLSHVPVHISMSNSPLFVCLVHIHLQTICLFVSLKNPFIFCWSIVHLSVSFCLLVGLSTHVISSILHYLLICQLICVAIRMHLAASNRWPYQKWLRW